MKNDCDFNLFCETVKKSGKYYQGYFNAHGTHFANHFKSVYMETIDAIINLIKDRLEQTGLHVFGQVEQQLFKSIMKDSVVDEMETLKFQR